MNNNNQILALRDNAKHELEKIKTIEDGMTHLNKLKSIDVWVKAEKKDAELQNIIAEQKLRTQRILGSLIQEKELNKGAAQPGWKNEVTNGNRVDTLADIGLNKKQSHTFQQIASIPDDDFEEFIQEKKQAVNNAVAELTTTGAMRLAKSLQEKKDELKVNTDLQERIAVEKELKQLAKEINLKYTKEERLFLINQIK
jgi:uncharacterized protein YcnI